MSRIRTLTREIADAMRISFNGESFAKVAARVAGDDLAIIRAEGDKIDAYAIVGQTGNVACIEAIEGRGGTRLMACIGLHAARNGLECEAWAMSQSRVKLAGQAGFVPTGETRMSPSGILQYRVTL